MHIGILFMIDRKSKHKIDKCNKLFPLSHNCLKSMHLKKNSHDWKINLQAFFWIEHRQNVFPDAGSASSGIKKKLHAKVNWIIRNHSWRLFESWNLHRTCAVPQKSERFFYHKNTSFFLLVPWKFCRIKYFKMFLLRDWEVWGHLISKDV